MRVLIEKHNSLHYRFRLSGAIWILLDQFSRGQDSCYFKVPYFLFTWLAPSKNVKISWYCCSFVTRNHKSRTPAMSRMSDEKNSLELKCLERSIYIMIELWFFSFNEWEFKIHLLRGRCFNITRWSEAFRPMRDSDTLKSFLIPRQEWPSFRPNQILWIIALENCWCPWP